MGTFVGQGRRQSALTIETYERDYRESASDLELVERLFYGGMATNQLRAALWPYLFGLVKRRGRFKLVPSHSTNSDGQQKTSSTSGNYSSFSSSDSSLNIHIKANENDCEKNAQEKQQYVYVEHRDNIKRWEELEKLYHNYQSQWESILPDQELRFSTFRERKALIERDVIRSDRLHPFYSQDCPSVRNHLQKLTTLLITYMMYDFDIGYLQGMSDIAAPILYVFDGDLVKSFWVFVEVMKLFRKNFEYSQKTIHFQLNSLFRLIKLTDPKFANYLKENECSNCFFAFRCIVCQFKRELMRNEGDKDYTKVLQLWDTIWSVQKRHELLAKSKYVHTFTIANGNGSLNGHHKHHHRHRHHHPHHHNHHHNHHHQRHLTRRGSNSPLSPQGTSHNGNSSNGFKSQSDAVSSSTMNGNSNHNSNHNNNNNNGLVANQNNGHAARKYSKDSLIQDTYNTNSSPANSKCNGNSNNNNNNSANGMGNRTNGNQLANSLKQHNSYNSTSPSSPCCCASSPASQRSNQQQTAPVKQEQIVYTKETFYSSFDPNQADVPRFELTETEKFVLSLCLSLIRRERNQILAEQLDASEIHQHFINPLIANDLDNFVESAYHIYHYLNTDCDLKLLVSKANELGPELSPQLGGVDVPLEAGVSPKEDTADTYDLLRDYLIISPFSYNASQASYTPNSRYRYSVSQKSWDRILNDTSPIDRSDSPLAD